MMLINTGISPPAGCRQMHSTPQLDLEEELAMASKRTIHAVKKSNYLTRADVDPPVIVTIREVVEETLANPEGDDELKQIVYFQEFEKGHVLNWINAQTIAKLLGSESFDDWPGGKIVLYDDPTVVFAGKVVGGIRVRAVRKRPVPHRNQCRRRSHRRRRRSRTSTTPGRRMKPRPLRRRRGSSRNDASALRT